MECPIQNARHVGHSSLVGVPLVTPTQRVEPAQNTGAKPSPAGSLARLGSPSRVGRSQTRRLSEDREDLE